MCDEFAAISFLSLIPHLLILLGIVKNRQWYYSLAAYSDDEIAKSWAMIFPHEKFQSDFSFCSFLGDIS